MLPPGASRLVSSAIASGDGMKQRRTIVGGAGAGHGPAPLAGLVTTDQGDPPRPPAPAFSM
ncbi:hypothetical protein STRIP9103_09485 [Streptomyces ipomoeae 91-03]|uniref:Uncharacterized protein n=1 Tax=Streptomyces ipomoeae 91-03 TaxID=698759 RepID=L1L5B3_9ACTN|nr:hypothetical protein STRIP9103_09485 [Streptomyces ipomoeae 91-03]